MSRSRLLLIVAGVAVLSLAAGLYAGTKITSPADAAAQRTAPEATPVTVPIEKRELRNQVVGRGDAAFAGSVEVTPQVGGELSIVTGQVPDEGDELNDGDVLLEVVGRPIIALRGELPMYRSLQPGMSGPDVKQLNESLQRLGMNPGVVGGEYTFGTAAAVARLYQRAGYPAPEPDEELKEAVREAQARLDDAEGDERAQAQQDLSKAQFAAATPLPSEEIVYIKSMPRRVDEVKVNRGDEVSGAVMSLSGAELRITMNLDDTAIALLSDGMVAKVELPSGDEADAKVQKIKDGKVTLKPQGLSTAQERELRDSNVKVTIGVESTGDKVLAVPLAAVTAGADGESRVEVMRNGEQQRVPVEVGLVAEGYAEISAIDGTLDEGDLVVVGYGGE